jgi:hypothetical protein
LLNFSLPTNGLKKNFPLFALFKFLNKEILFVSVRYLACNKPNGNCAALNATSGQWSAVNCTTALPYLCEVPPVGGWSNPVTNSPPAPTPKPCPANWFKSRVMNNPFCYLMVEKAVSWTNASAACRAYGGDLASITSVAIQEELYLHCLSS